MHECGECNSIVVGCGEANDGSYGIVYDFKQSSNFVPNLHTWNLFAFREL